MDRVTVSCPNGHTIKTTIRGRGTSCRTCHKVVYVRLDGTARQTAPAPPATEVAEAAPVAGTSGGPEFGTRRGWGPRHDQAPEAADVVHYDPAVKRTAMWDEHGKYLGHMTGDPFDLSG
jgi:hypothetical protein